MMVEIKCAACGKVVTVPSRYRQQKTCGEPRCAARLAALASHSSTAKRPKHAKRFTFACVVCKRDVSVPWHRRDRKTCNSAACRRERYKLRAAPSFAEPAREADTWASEWTAAVMRHLSRGLERRSAEERASAEMMRRLG